MKSKRKVIYLLVTLLISSLLIAGCGAGQAAIVEGKVNVFTTFFPLYDFTKKIGGEHVNVVNLVPTGVEPHDWSPKSKDLKGLNQAQLFIYNGAGFEGWVHDFLDGVKKDSKLVLVEASKGAEFIPATMDKHEKEDEHKHEEKKKDGHGHDEEESNVDPHIWLSPLQAKKMAENVKNGLIQADAAHKADYEANYNKLIGQLDQLHTKFKDEISKTNRKEFVTSHQAFGYLARDYGLRQVPIMGLAPDAEPTSKDLMEISKFVKENQVKYILFEELVSDKLAKTLANDLNIQTLVLSPLEGITEEQAKAGEDYVTLMNKNLTNLLKALQ
ncbi:metal ABC transporter substrate-binding protein [Paenibacillus silviterrae]|uniref:metal ABC transporter substrate-binding protein n=1 Tax=Paenibacillus silviterrae TaxID=3242194 RepID=UPI0025432FBB|nr:metal ABC transporter substrate-binding protein [Paenibacillus chinjuensis]